MNVKIYPCGDFTTLPLSAATAQCASALFARLDQEQWDRLTLPTTDFATMAHELTNCTTLHLDFNAAEIYDALCEVSQVAEFGWPGYVDAFCQAGERKRRRGALVQAAWICAAVALAAAAVRLHKRTTVL
jgi:hypothetical protein